MRKKLEVIWEYVMALGLLWLTMEVWGVDLLDLPFWRQASGMLLLLASIEYIDSAGNNT